MDMYKKERLMDRYRTDAKLYTYRNLRRVIVKNIDILKKLDKVPDVYGVENQIVYENTSFTLEHLFICAFMCFCIGGLEIDDMSHLNYMSVKFCEDKLAIFDEKYYKYENRR